MGRRMHYLKEVRQGYVAPPPRSHNRKQYLVTSLVFHECTLTAQNVKCQWFFLLLFFLYSLSFVELLLWIFLCVFFSGSESSQMSGLRERGSVWTVDMGSSSRSRGWPGSSSAPIRNCHWCGFEIPHQSIALKALIWLLKELIWQSCYQTDLSPNQYRIMCQCLVSFHGYGNLSKDKLRNVFCPWTFKTFPSRKSRPLPPTLRTAFHTHTHTHTHTQTHTT